MAATFDSLSIGDAIEGRVFGVRSDTLFHDAIRGETIDLLDGADPIARMLGDWAAPLGAIHRRLEARWVKLIRPGDTIRPFGLIKAKRASKKSRYVMIDVVIRNQSGKTVATGEAVVEFPRDLICP
jgi:3-hydroxybutyryl-CoA dehydratase